ncbi:MAG: hypothetical protein WB975_08980, partial [Nitrososphaeraceae archaeon]
NYLLSGIPIINACSFIINIISTMLNEIITPTRNVTLNAMVYGLATVEVSTYKIKIVPSPISQRDLV